MMRGAYSTGWDAMGLVDNLPDASDEARKIRENTRNYRFLPCAVNSLVRQAPIKHS